MAHDTRMFDYFCCSARSEPNAGLFQSAAPTPSVARQAPLCRCSSASHDLMIAASQFHNSKASCNVHSIQCQSHHNKGVNRVHGTIRRKRGLKSERILLIVGSFCKLSHSPGNRKANFTTRVKRPLNEVINAYFGTEVTRPCAGSTFSMR